LCPAFFELVEHAEIRLAVGAVRVDARVILGGRPLRRGLHTCRGREWRRRARVPRRCSFDPTRGGDVEVRSKCAEGLRERLALVGLNGPRTLVSSCALFPGTEGRSDIFHEPLSRSHVRWDRLTRARTGTVCEGAWWLKHQVAQRARASRTSRPKRSGLCWCFFLDGIDLVRPSSAAVTPRSLHRTKLRRSG